MKTLLCFFAIFASTTLLVAQNIHPPTCATDQITAQMRAQNPELYQQLVADFERNIQNYIQNHKSGDRSVITIPVVFHIVHKDTAVLNDITPAQIQSQIDALNRDFAQENADFAFLESVFTARCNENADIQFCLAQRDPDGNICRGIEYKQTTSIGFKENEDGDPSKSVKRAPQGFDAWDPNRYLNIWVCEIVDGPTGFAALPPLDISDQWRDGVVIDYRSFGSIGRRSTAVKHYSRNMGRTCVHEVAHYLGILHLWGPSDMPLSCGDDFCGDTPPQNLKNTNRPTFPMFNTWVGSTWPFCPDEASGVMFMNHMDYTDDKTRIAFTNDQKELMNATIVGYRPGFTFTSTTCQSGAMTQRFRPCSVLSHGVYIDNITTTSASIRWLSTHATAYKVRYKPETSSTWVESPFITTNRYDISGLLPDKKYQVQVLYYLDCAYPVTSAISFSTYGLVAAPSPLLPDAPNNLGSASVINISSGIAVVEGHVIGNSTDEDYFKFTTTSGKTNFQVILDYLPLDYDVKVYKNSTTSDNNIVNYPYYSFNPYTMPEVVNYNTADVATYYVRIFSYRGNFSNSNAYRLTVKTSGTPFGKADIEDVLEQENNTLQIGSYWVSSC